MLAVAQKMFPNPFYVVQLHIFWMFDKEFGFAFVIGKNNSIIFENGKIDTILVGSSCNPKPP